RAECRRSSRRVRSLCGRPGARSHIGCGPPGTAGRARGPRVTLIRAGKQPQRAQRTQRLFFFVHFSLDAVEARSTSLTRPAEAEGEEQTPRSPRALRLLASRESG